MDKVKYRSLFLLFILLNFSPYYAFAAEIKDSSNLYKKQFHISISGGLAIPLGMYGSTNYYPGSIAPQHTATDAGFASTGTDFNIMGDRPINKNWSLTVECDYMHNWFNSSDVIEASNNFYSYPPIILSSSPPFKAYTWSMNPTIEGNYFYTNYSFLAGFTDTTKIGRRLTLGLCALGGLLYFSSPALYATINGSVQDSTGTKKYNFTENWDYNSSHYITFAADFGISLKYPVSSKISLAVSADILLSSARFDPTYQIIDAAGNVLLTGDFNDPINITELRTSIGIEYNL